MTIASGAATGAPNRSAGGGFRSGVLIPVGPLHHAGTTVSTNWSGYVVNQTGVSAVTSTFTIPTASSPPNGYAVTWTGIGGFGTSDLIQAGVAELKSGTKPHYYPWYELLPADWVPLRDDHSCSRESSCAVAPGQRVTVTITEVSTNRWSIVLRDPGHWKWSKTVTYDSARKSAEWILEAPQINGVQSTLPAVSTAFFGPTSTYTLSGTSHPISAGNPVEVLMEAKGAQREATPSALVNDEEFNDCAWAASCAQP